MKAKALFVCMMTLTATAAFAMSELDAEVNDLQVHLRKAQVTQKKASLRPKVVLHVRPKAKAAPIEVATAKALDADPAPVLAKSREVTPPPSSPPVTTIAEENPPSENINAPAEIRAQNVTARTSRAASGDPFFMRLTALGFATIGSFNGPDGSYVISRNVGNPYSGGPSGSLLTDLNILGSHTFVIETGAEVSSLGAYTGYDPTILYNNTPAYQDRVTLVYGGVPINLKWMFGGEHASTAYVKAGVTPNYLMNAQYSLYGNVSYASQDSYGGFNNFDVLVNGGVGFSLKISKELHAVADLGYYQGIVPLSKYFNIYNTGFRVGAGISYLL